MMKIKNKSGFTLLELLITILIMSIVLLIGIPNILTQIKFHQVNQDSVNLAQMVELARSTSIKASRTVYVDLSQADTRQDNEGGKVSIYYTDAGNNRVDVSDFTFSSNILVSSDSTTGDFFGFDFRGRPVPDTGNFTDFDTTNNQIILGYFGGDNIKASKTVTISPLTGEIGIN